MKIENEHDYHEGFELGLKSSLDIHPPDPFQGVEKKNAFYLGYIRGLQKQTESANISYVVDDVLLEMQGLLLKALEDHHLYYPHLSNYVKLLRICETLKSLSPKERKQKDS